MLNASFTLLTLAVTAGTILALWHLRGGAPPRPPVAAGVAHGLIGIAGLAVLWPIAFGPPRGATAGAAAFGPMSAWMFAAAALAGAALLLRRHRTPAVMMAIHGGIAITGYVLLVAWYSVG